MKLKIIDCYGKETILNNVDTFEIRRNSLSGWLKVRYKNDKTEMFQHIATIKSIK